jgi:DHA1 family bicyclomycin/chloramphenicol resistance-like MFS transporter
MPWTRIQGLLNKAQQNDIVSIQLNLTCSAMSFVFGNLMNLLHRLQHNLTIRFWVLMFITPFTGICIDLYVPSLPAISLYFHTTPQLSQMTVPIFLIGYSIANFFLGPISDSIGRKKILLVGLFFCAAFPYIAIFSPNITTLLCLRFLQGVAISAPGGLMRTIMADSFEGKRLKHVVNYSTTVWALGPIIAPGIGGYLQVFFGWKASFLCYVCYGIFLLILCMILLPETNRDQHPLNYLAKKADMIEMLKDGPFRAFIVLMMAGYGYLLIFNVLGPFLVQHHLGFSAIVYGHMAMILGIGWLLGSVSNRLLSIQYSSKQCLILGAYGLFIMTGLFWIIAMTTPLTLWTLVLPSLFLFAAASICFTNTFGFILARYPKRTGTASSLYGSSMILGTGILSYLAGFTHLTSQFPMLWIFTVFTAVIIYCITYAMKRST